MTASRSKAGGGGGQRGFIVPFLRNPGFVGREEDLAEVHALLQGGRAVGVRPVAASGMGGIGKTQLAVEYAYRYADAFPGGVYWVNAANDWQAELAALAERVGLREDDAQESLRQGRLALAFAAFLGEHPGALVIFDNVEDPLALQDPTLAVMPAALPGRLLFTTRRRDKDGPFASFEVRVLPEDFALQLLLSSEARRATTELDVAREICRALGNLPLAIVLAASYLGKSPRVSLAEYLGRLRREGGLAAVDAAKVDRRKLATLHDAAVGATLTTQWAAVGSEDARRVLKAAALLGEATQVSRGTLALLTGLSDVAEGGYGAPLEEALDELEGWSLVEELGAREIRLHPLGVDAVLGDLRIGVQLSQEGEVDAGWIERLARPLDREAHCLRRWKPAERPELLLQQVRNRCFNMGEADGCGLAEAMLAERGLRHLRERIRTGRESEALVRTLEDHTSPVAGVAVTADGRWAVSASYDATLKIWDFGSGKLVRTLEGHTSGVSGVAVTADGCWAVSASDDKTLKVWDLGSGKLVRTLEGHTNGVNGVAVTADGCWAISASDDKTLKVWDLETALTVATVEAPFSCCAVATNHLIVAGDAAGALHILDWISPAGTASPPRPAAPRRPPRPFRSPPSPEDADDATPAAPGGKHLGAELHDLSTALLDAFPTRSALGQMVRFRLDRNLDAITSDRLALATAVFELLTTAEAQGWLDDLIDAALLHVPDNPALRALGAGRRPAGNTSPPRATRRLAHLG